MIELITELAVYEKAADQVVVTVKDLEQNGFGKNPIFNFFVAEYEGYIIGLALYYIKYSTWKGRCIFLEDIIVTEKFRGKKVGAKLFEKIIEVAKNEKVKRLEWQVLNWNEPALNFYKKYNAYLDSEWINAKLVFD